jgi:hypothetical protein
LTRCTTRHSAAQARLCNVLVLVRGCGRLLPLGRILAPRAARLEGWLAPPTALPPAALATRPLLRRRRARLGSRWS